MVLDNRLVPRLGRGQSVHCIYISDVLRRVGEHPQSKLEELLPRNWKNLYLEEAKVTYGEGPKIE